MDLSLSPEQKALSESAASLLADKAPLEQISEVSATDTGYDKALYELMVSLGWSSLGLVDGEGTLLEFGLIATQLGSYATPSPLPASVYAGVTAKRLGSGEAARAVVDGVTGGTPATLVAGDRLDIADGRVHGTVSAVEWAPVARTFVIVSRGELFAVDATASGVTVEPQEAMDNTRLGSVTFDGAAAERLGTFQKDAWREHVHLLRLLRAADMCGSAQRVLDMSVAHVKQREQFGRPLAMFQAVQHHVANTFIEVSGADFLIRQALWRYAVGLPYERHAAMAAWHTGETAVRATQIANQLHGGIGFMKEYHLHHFFHRVIAQRSRMGPEQERLRDLGDVVVEAAQRGYHQEFVEWPVAPAEGWSHQ